MVTGSPEERERIAQSVGGDLATVPFAVLLDALARARRTAVVHLVRRQVWKEVVFDGGIPVDCQSNLIHETLGRFMVAAGRLDEETFNGCLSESCARGLRLGEVLCERGLIAEDSLHRVLQQNLARKLLDLFSWREGDFEIRATEPEATGLRINVPQLIVMGVTRFATQERVDGTIGPLIGKPLVLHPRPFFPLADIRLSASQMRVVDALRQRPQRIDELATASGLDPRDLTRLIHALTLLDVVVPQARLAELTSAASPTVTPAAPRPAEPDAGAVARRELLRLGEDFRHLEPRRLLGLDPDVDRGEIDRGFLSFAETFAPWRYTEALRGKATEVFLAGVRAYSALTTATPSAVTPGVSGREPLQEAAHEPVSRIPGARAVRDRFRLRTTLLDPDIQFRKGRSLLNAGEYRTALEQLEYASDLDPQNSTYLAELGYCRFLVDPERGAPMALGTLTEVLRLEPRHGLALFYSGEILFRVGRLEEAKSYLERSIKPLAPDRRPIEALKVLQSALKK